MTFEPFVMTPATTSDTPCISTAAAAARGLLLLACFAAMSAPALRAQQVIKAAPDKKLPVPEEQLTDAELVQQMVSHHLVGSEHERTEDLTAQMAIVIGDVRRVVGLPKERQRMLEIAAKGAVDRTLEGWRSAQENNVRQQVTGLAPPVVEQRLASLGTVRVGNETPEKHGLWSASIENVLTPDERSRWTTAEGERYAYRVQALAQMLVAELDRQVGLTLTQCEKLEPLAMTALQDYLPDMSNYMDRNSGIDFRMLMLLLSGVPQAETQAVLTPDQYGKWQQLTADFRGWWQSIEQNHRARANTGKADGRMVLPQQGGRVIINGGNVIIKGAK